MTAKAPNGLSEVQWEAITGDLNVSPSTKNDYRKVVERLHAHQNHRYSILTMTHSDAVEYFRYLEEESGLSVNTVHRYEATLRSIGMHMEKARSVFPDYRNPFRGILKKEVRTRSVYSRKDFLSPEHVRKILNVLPQLSKAEQLIMELMILNGFLPRHICSLSIRDFRMSGGVLSVTFSEGLLRSREPHKNRNLKKKSESAAGVVTWESRASFRFFDESAKIIMDYIPDIGRNNDTRPFFMTSRHRPYTYHSIHHLVRTVCELAGLSDRSITPQQLSMYGTIHTYMMETELHKHNRLTREIKKETSPQAGLALEKELAACESVFLPLAKLGWIGCWDQDFPACMAEKIRDIRSQLGDDILYQIIGISPKR
ncbi:MAG: hypothetical protein IKG46_12855 [Solobacterium sp.]|nr:hypothetical protein [Solobacterium sp.]